MIFRVTTLACVMSTSFCLLGISCAFQTSKNTETPLVTGQFFKRLKKACRDKEYKMRVDFRISNIESQKYPDSVRFFDQVGVKDIYTVTEVYKNQDDTYDVLSEEFGDKGQISKKFDYRVSERSLNKLIDSRYYITEKSNCKQKLLAFLEQYD